MVYGDTISVGDGPLAAGNNLPSAGCRRQASLPWSCPIVAKLSDADLSRSDLFDANLFGVDLSDWDLRATVGLD